MLGARPSPHSASCWGMWCQEDVFRRGRECDCLLLVFAAPALGAGGMRLLLPLSLGWAAPGQSEHADLREDQRVADFI